IIESERPNTTEGEERKINNDAFDVTSGRCVQGPLEKGNMLKLLGVLRVGRGLIHGGRCRSRGAGPEWEKWEGLQSLHRRPRAGRGLRVRGLYRLRALERQLHALGGGASLQGAELLFQDVEFPGGDSAVDVSCSGCGALLHCCVSGAPGYLPGNKFKELRLEGGLGGAVCQRCHLLTHHNQALQVELSAEGYAAVVKRLRPLQGLLLLVVDLLDLPDSLPSDLISMVGDNKRIVVLGNKVDLLPGDAPNYLQRIRRQLEAYCAAAGLQVSEVQLISARQASASNSWSPVCSAPGVTVATCTWWASNAGKSSLFNALLQSDYCKSRAADRLQRATVSPWPGTTLDLLKFPIINPTPYRIDRGRVGRTFRTAPPPRDEIQFDPDSLALGREGRPRQGEQQGALCPGRAAGGAVTQASSRGRCDSGRAAGGAVTQASSRGAVTQCEQQGALASSRRRCDSGRAAGGAVTQGEQQGRAVTLQGRSSVPASPRQQGSEEQEGNWLYDTPGIIKQHDILALLSEQEVMSVVPTQALVPRTFVLQEGASLLVGGLARIDFIKGGGPCWFSVLVSSQIPVHISTLERVQEALICVALICVACSGSDLCVVFSSGLCGVFRSLWCVQALTALICVALICVVCSGSGLCVFRSLWCSGSDLLVVVQALICVACPGSDLCGALICVVRSGSDLCGAFRLICVWRVQVCVVRSGSDLCGVFRSVWCVQALICVVCSGLCGVFQALICVALICVGVQALICVALICVVRSGSDLCGAFRSALICVVRSGSDLCGAFRSVWCVQALTVWRVQALICVALIVWRVQALICVVCSGSDLVWCVQVCVVRSGSDLCGVFRSVWCVQALICVALICVACSGSVLWRVQALICVVCSGSDLCGAFRSVWCVQALICVVCSGSDLCGVFQVCVVRSGSDLCGVFRSVWCVQALICVALICVVCSGSDLCGVFRLCSVWRVQALICVVCSGSDLCGVFRSVWCVQALICVVCGAFRSLWCVQALICVVCVVCSGSDLCGAFRSLICVALICVALICVALICVVRSGSDLCGAFRSVWCVQALICVALICVVRSGSDLCGAFRSVQALICVVPAGGSERMKDFPPLVPQDVRLQGVGYQEAAGDLKLSSAGWVSVTAPPGDQLLLRLHGPEDASFSLRTPPLLPHLVKLKGDRVRKSVAYRTLKHVVLQREEAKKN
ncbi:hypothetical protein KUCAC02_035200, partial [Chaenocephalus aceratus]